MSHLWLGSSIKGTPSFVYMLTAIFASRFHSLCSFVLDQTGPAFLIMLQSLQADTMETDERKQRTSYRIDIFFMQAAFHSLQNVSAMTNEVLVKIREGLKLKENRNE